MPTKLPISDEHRAILMFTDIYWMGLTGTLYAMHQEGWEVVIDDRPDMAAVQVVMYHKEMSSYYLSQLFDWHTLNDVRQMARSNQQSPYIAGTGMGMPRLRMNISHYVADAYITIQGDVRSWKNTDYIPAEMSSETVKLSALQLFNEGKEEPKIIKPESVPELMAKILQLQEPNQAQIRKKIQQERRKVKEEAKIITLAG